MQTKLFLKERLLYINNFESLSYTRGTLIYRRSDTKTVQRIKIGNIKDSVRLIERLMRREPRCAAKIDDSHFIISFNGSILNYDCLSNSTAVEHRFDKGMKNPLTFLTVKTKAQDFATIYYGEYIWNANKGPVAIYKRGSDGWRKAYEFPSNTILHIHNIVEDLYRKGFIILTGDSNEESGIWFADEEFKNVEPIVKGSQQYRACVAFPTEHGIIYATDTPLEKNHIYFMKLDERHRMIDISVEFEIPGPCIYGAEHDGNFYFSTSVEPDSSLPSWRYRLSYRLGAGVKDRFTHVICRNRGGQYKDIFQAKKDIFPMWLFQFGNVLYPKNDSEDLYVVLQGTAAGHGVTLKL